MSGAKIINAIQEAIEGDISRVTINGEAWAKVKDIHADQQAIMEVNNTLRETLLAIKLMVCGDRVPNWEDDWATTHMRGRIADIVDSVVR